MPYNANTFEELDSFEKIQDELEAVALALNIVDILELPDKALDTQHFAQGVAGVWGTVSRTSDLTIVEPAYTYNDTWPPPDMSGWADIVVKTGITWDPLGEYEVLHVKFNASLYSMSEPPGDPYPGSEYYFVVALAVEQGGVYRIVPVTVRPFSIKDRKISNTDVLFLDLAVSTMLHTATLPSTGPVTKLKAVGAIHGGSGVSISVLDVAHITWKSLKTGDLGV